MKISVLTPAYNAAKYIDQLLASVERQDHRNYEHIVLDDGSTDDTADRVRRYSNAVVVSRENRGQFATLNELLHMATGDAFVVICADDYFANTQVFSAAVKALSSPKAPDIVVGRTPRWMERKRPYQVKPDVPLRIGVKTVRRRLAVQHCSMFVRTAFQRSNAVFFDDGFKMCGDWDWMCRLWAANPAVKVVNEDFGVWRQHPEQKSEKYAHIGKEEALRILREQNVSHRSHRILTSAYGAYSKASHAAAVTSAYGLTALLPSRRR